MKTINVSSCARYSLIAALMISGVSLASEEKYSTKLSLATEKASAIVVRGFSHVGSVRPEVGSVSVFSETVIVQGSPPSTLTGAAVEISRAGIGSVRVLIDADEIPALIRALDYLASVDGKVTRESDFEATYVTRGGLELSVFSAEGTGEISGGISLAYDQRVFVPIERGELASLKAILSSMPK